MDKAREHIERARTSDPDNRYIVDLELKIALARRDLHSGEALIARLAHVDQPSFVLFRRSMISHLRGSVTQALDYARDAVEMASREGRPTFEMLAQLTKCLVDHGEFEEASQVLSKLDRVFANRRNDVRTGLWCKWEIAQKRWEDAAARWEKLKDKTKPVHLAMRRSIIEGSLQRSSLSAKTRDLLEKERAEIEQRLKEIGPDSLWLSEVAEDALFE
jgi:hypothetical protein